MLYNDEASTITYFKDITFGILYEKMTYKVKMQDKISKTLQQMVTKPIINAIQNLKEVTENSDEDQPEPK